MASSTQFLLVFVCCLLALLSGISDARKPINTFKVNYPSLYPEGWTYWENKSLFVMGGLGANGTLVSFDHTTNTTSVLVETPNAETIGVTGASGVYVDQANNLIYACLNGPFAQPGSFFGAGAWDLSTLQNIWVSDLRSVVSVTGNTHLCNDITSDLKGGIYVTDSITNVVVKLDAITGVGSIFVDSTVFPNPGGFGFDGIVYHPPSDTIIVNDVGQGKLYRVPLSSGQSGASVIDVFPRHGNGTAQPGPPRLHLQNSTSTPGGLSLFGCDGMILSNDNKYLLVVLNPTGLVSLMKQAPGVKDWSEVRVIRNKFYPRRAIATNTTFAPSDLTFDNSDNLWVIDSQTYEFVETTQRRSTFVAAEVDFREFEQ